MQSEQDQKIKRQIGYQWDNSLNFFLSWAWEKRFKLFKACIWTIIVHCNAVLCMVWQGVPKGWSRNCKWLPTISFQVKCLFCKKILTTETDPNGWFFLENPWWAWFSVNLEVLERWWKKLDMLFNWQPVNILWRVV